MTQKQVKLLQLFKEIDKICRDNNIKYYLAGGSLIGALRHRGFIPWDDDMDLYMTKSEWDRFVEACKTQMPEGRKLEVQDLDREYYNNFPRYVDEYSTAIHKAQILYKDTAGYVIDILTLDPISDDNEWYNKYLDDLMLYSDLVNYTVVYSYRWNANKNRYKYYRFLEKLSGKEKVLKKLEDRMFTYPEDKASRYAMRWGGAPFIFPKYWFDEVVSVPFEDTEALVPKYCVEYLTWHYGDEWMYIPPHDQQESHEAVYSLEHDYEPIRQEILSRIDPKKQEKSYIKRKKSIFSSMKSFHRLLDENRSLKANASSIDFNVAFAKRKNEILSLYSENKFLELFDIFADYYSVQLSADMIGREDFVNIYRFHHPILVSLEDEEILNIAFDTLINVEKISKAMRIIDVIEITTGSISTELAQKREFILRFRSAVVDFEKCNVESSKRICYELLKSYPNCLSCIKLMIRILQAEGIDKNKDEILSLINIGLAQNPTDGEYLKYQGDLIVDSDLSFALKEYIQAYMNTQNGLVHLEILDAISANINEFVNVLLNEEDKDIALAEVDAALELLPFNKLIFAAKCKLLQRSIADDFLPIPQIVKDLKKYVLSAENKEELAEVYADFFEKFVDNKEIRCLIVEQRLTEEYQAQIAFIDKCKKLLTQFSGGDKAWILKIIANTYKSIGDYQNNYDYLIKASECAESDLLKFLIARSFLSFLNHSFHQAITLKRAEHHGIIVQSKKDERLYLEHWSNKYPSIISAVNHYSDLGIIPKEGIPFIETFGILNLTDDEDNVWTLKKLRQFRKMCFSAAKGVFYPVTKNEDDEDENGDAMTEFFGFEQDKLSDEDDFADSDILMDDASNAEVEDL